MLINNLNLQNYGAIKDAKLKFQKGFNIISGANGQGKSHIIRAIAYLLLDHTEKKIEDDCNWDNDTFSIQTYIQHQSKDFNIQAKFNGKSASKKLIIGTDDVYDSNSEVKEALAKYFDPYYCKPAIISFQGEMDIVSSKPAARRDYLKKIYDLDFKNEIKELEDKLSILTTDKIELDKQIAILQNKHYDFKEEKQEPFTKDEYNKKVEEVELLKKEKQIIQNQIDLYESKLSQLQNVEKQITYFKSEVEKQNKDIQEAKIVVTSSQEKLDKLTDEHIQKLKEEENKLTLARIKDFDDTQITKLRDEVSTKKNDLKYIEKHISLIEEGKCPTCGREFEEGDKSTYKKQKQNLEKEIDNIFQKLRELEQQQKEHKQKKEENEKIKEKKKDLQNKIQLEENKLRSEKERLEDRIVSYNDIIEKAHNIVADHRSKLEELETQKSTIDIPDEKPQLPNDIDEKIEILRNEIKQYETIVQENKWIKEENVKLTKQKKEDEKQIKELDKKLHELINDAQHHEQAVQVLKKQFPNFVIDSMKGSLEDGMNDLLNTAYNNRYQVAIQEKRDGLIITYGKKDKDINLASGAEKNIFNIGFKYSFNKLAGLGVLICDEADEFMDTNVAKSVFGAIHSMIENEELNQVFLITHKDELKKMLITDYNAKMFEVDNGQVEEVRDF